MSSPTLTVIAAKLSVFSDATCLLYDKVCVLMATTVKRIAVYSSVRNLLREAALLLRHWCNVSESSFDVSVGK